VFCKRHPVGSFEVVFLGSRPRQLPAASSLVRGRVCAASGLYAFNQGASIVRKDINPVEADAIRDAAMRVLEHGESVGSIARDWTERGIKPVAAKQWWPTSIVGALTSGAKRLHPPTERKHQP
jgi:hypothetical protein